MVVLARLAVWNTMEDITGAPVEVIQGMEGAGTSTSTSTLPWTTGATTGTQ